MDDSYYILLPEAEDLGLYVTRFTPYHYRVYNHPMEERATKRIDVYPTKKKWVDPKTYRKGTYTTLTELLIPYFNLTNEHEL